MRVESAVFAAVLTFAVSTTPVRAEPSCVELVRAGGKVIDSYVMDFGPSDKLYVYIVRTRSGATEKCTSERPLRAKGR